MNLKKKYALAGLVLASSVAAAIAVVPANAEQRGGHRVVLGSKDFAPYGKGFGHVKPEKIFNGGTVTGLVKSIRWRHWGDPISKGRGRGYQYRPGGGIYRRTVKVKLRARKLGECPGENRHAYKQLEAKFQERPGGKFGGWFSWAGSGSICSFEL